jgi:hypothetical protein
MLVSLRHRGTQQALSCFETHDRLLALNVADRLQQQGYAIQECDWITRQDNERQDNECQDNGRMASIVSRIWWVGAGCSGRKLRATVRRCRRWVRWRRCWQGGAGEPLDRSGWAYQFERYIASRWYDSEHPLPHLFVGPNAGDPTLVPLVMVAMGKGVYDLADPLTAIVWSEYLSEYPQRRRAWRRFQHQNGRCSALYWENAHGRQWEAKQAKQ